jgi:hypothetical protein
MAATNWKRAGKSACGGARDRDAAGFQRLAQDFEHAALELGQFVEEQHAVMGQRDFAGAWIAAAADQAGALAVWCGLRNGRRPQRRVEAAGRAGFARGGLQRLGFGHRRQQAGSAGRASICPCRAADQQHRMLARRGDFHRAAGLPGRARRACPGRRRCRWAAGGWARGRAARAAARCDGRRRAAWRRQTPTGFDQRRFAAVVACNDEGARRVTVGYARALSRQPHCHGQRAAHRAQIAGQRQLAGKLEGIQRVARHCPLAARMPSAIARSNRPDSLGSRPAPD